MLPELSDRDRALLEFEERWGSRATAAKDEAILLELRLKPTRYYQLINGLMDDPAAIAAMPELVKRLQRVRARRVETRAGRAFRRS